MKRGAGAAAHDALQRPAAKRAGPTTPRRSSALTGAGGARNGLSHASGV